MAVKWGHLLAILAVALVAVGYLASQGYIQLPKLGQLVITEQVGTTETGGEAGPAPHASESEAAHETKGAEVSASVCPTKGETIGTSTAPLYLEVRDALNPKAGIEGLTVEVLPPDEIPWDPQRYILDSATTDANGIASFTGASLKVGELYQWVVRGDTTTYDKIVFMETPCRLPEALNVPFKITPPIYVYKVGNISLTVSNNNIGSLSGNVITINITELGLSGINTLSFDAAISQGVSGAAIIDPVLVLRSPEGYELESGVVMNIYAAPETGYDFGIPGSDLSSYLIGAAPISMSTRESFTDSKGVTHYVWTTEKATYSFTITFDADSISKEQILRITFDDLGDYNAKDVATRSSKASPAYVDIKFTV